MLVKKICLVGDFAVGKTSLINRFVQNQFSDEYLTTVGVKLDTKILTLKNGQPLKFIIWDIAGADKLTTAKQSYIEGASGYIAVYDVTRPKTLAAMTNIQHSVKETIGEVPFVIAANKCDLENVTGDPDADVLNRASHFVRTSAMNGDGVENTFGQLGEAVAQIIK